MNFDREHISKREFVSAYKQLKYEQKRFEVAALNLGAENQEQEWDRLRESSSVKNLKLITLSNYRPQFSLYATI